MRITSDTKIYAGANQIVKVYKGSNIIYPSEPGGLPTEYQQVEYIKGTGTQYINTNYYANGQTKVEISISEISVSGVIFGAYNTTWETGFGMYSNAYSDFWYHYYGNKQIKFTPPTNFVMIYDKGKTIINDVQRASTAEKTFTINYPMYVLAGNWYGTRADQPITCKLRYLKIYDNGTLVRDYVPCYRKSDSVIGLYDLVNNEFKTNAGSGTFIKGNDV